MEAFTGRERPILYGGPMVRAYLAGLKWQTRRVVKPQPSEHHWRGLPGYEMKLSGPLLMADGRLGVRFHHTIPQNREWDSDRWVMCPYGAPGDRLWGRETFRFTDPFDKDSPVRVGERCLDAGYPKPWAPIQYEADGARTNWINVGSVRDYKPAPGKLRPGIHMPRWASRITQDITAIRVERLQDISEADCRAEGCNGGHGSIPNYPYSATPREHYRHVWEAINGAGSWDANPYVWVIEYPRYQGATA